MTQALTHPRIKPLRVLQASLAGKNERLTGMWTLTDRQTTHRGQISLLLVTNFTIYCRANGPPAMPESIWNMSRAGVLKAPAQ